MRLICPNCGAQYEVGDDVIPNLGRDVQCSNCGHTWFERPGQSEAQEADEDYLPPSPVPVVETAVPQRSDPDVTPDPRVEGHGVQSDAPDVDADDHAPASSDDEPPPGDDPPDGDAHPRTVEPGVGVDPAALAAPQAAPPDLADTETRARRPLSPQIAEILREEAAREEAARRAEAQAGLESQPDLGLEAPVDRDARLAEESRRRMARLKGEAALPVGAPVRSRQATRGDMLPDIEEINSTLRSTSERSAAPLPTPEAQERRNRSGFRWGFSVVLVAAALATLVYTYAPRIAAAAPPIAPALEGYVNAIDSGRLWLDLRLQGLLERVQSADGVTPQPSE